MNPLQPLKSVLMFILFITLIAAATYVSYNRGLLNEDSLAQISSRLSKINPDIDVDTQPIEEISQSAKEQSETLIERGGVVLGESKNFIDTQVKPSDDKEPLHNKAFEYARYMYCQQVVSDYQEKN